MPEEWKMEEITVSVVNDAIFMSQPDVGMGEQQLAFQPEQIDLLIEWLKEAKEELLRQRITGQGK